MAIKYPDILEHNNPARALIDESVIRGSYKVVESNTDRDTIPPDKRKLGMLCTVRDRDHATELYIGQDISDIEWAKEDNWRNILSSPGGERVEISFDANLEVDLKLGTNLWVLLTGDITKLTFINGVEGREYKLRLIQDTQGMRSIQSSNGDIVYNNNTPPYLSIAPNKQDMLEVHFVDGKYRIIKYYDV